MGEEEPNVTVRIVRLCLMIMAYQGGLVSIERLSLQLTPCKEHSLSYDQLIIHHCQSINQALTAVDSPFLSRLGHAVKLPISLLSSTTTLITVARSPHTKETRIGPQFSLNLVSPVLAAPLALPQTPP